MSDSRKDVPWRVQVTKTPTPTRRRLVPTRRRPVSTRRRRRAPCRRRHRRVRTPTPPRCACRTGRGTSRRQAGAACPTRNPQRRRHVGARFRRCSPCCRNGPGCQSASGGAGVARGELARRVRVVALGVPVHRGMLGSALLHGLPIPARMLMSCPHIHISGTSVLPTPGGKLEYAWDRRYG